MLIRDREASVQLTVWESEYPKINFSQGDFIIVQNAIIRDFSGKTLNATYLTEFLKDDYKDKRVQSLKEFFENTSNLLNPVPCITNSV